MSITVSYTGSVTRNAQIRTDDDETFLLFDTVADGTRLAGEAAARLSVACFGDDIEALAPWIVKHAEVHIEGRLILRELNGGCTVLAVVASRVGVLGQRGRVVGRIGGNK